MRLASARFAPALPNHLWMECPALMKRDDDSLVPLDIDPVATFGPQQEVSGAKEEPFSLPRRHLR